MNLTACGETPSPTFTIPSIAARSPGGFPVNDSKISKIRTVTPYRSGKKPFGIESGIFNY